MIELIDGALAGRAHGEVVALAFLDLDGLKDVNDAFGHRTGDELEGAGHGYRRGRAGDATGALALPFWIGGQVVQVGVTAGLCHAPRDAQARDELMRGADLALHAAKNKQRGSVAHFEPAMDVEFDERRFLEKELRLAIENKSFDVHYQPIVSSDGNCILGAEALMRWTHPVRGPIQPVQFVAVAEQAGLMGRLGEFVLRRALSDARRWPGLYMSVNLSPVQVRDPALVELVSDILAKNDIAPSRLCSRSPRVC